MRRILFLCLAVLPLCGCAARIRTAGTAGLAGVNMAIEEYKSSIREIGVLSSEADKAVVRALGAPLELFCGSSEEKREYLAALARKELQISLTDDVCRK